MDHIRILGTEPSSEILTKQDSIKNEHFLFFKDLYRINFSQPFPFLFSILCNDQSALTFAWLKNIVVA